MLFIITIVWESREFEETVQVVSYYAVLTKMLIWIYAYLRLLDSKV